MGELRGLVEEQVLHDHQLHRLQRRVHVVRVRVALGDVLALHVQRPEGAVDRGVEHVRDAQARLGQDRHAPQVLVDVADVVVADVAVAGQLVRERAHVARTLHVVLAAERVHAHAARPMLPVTIARLAIAITIVEPWLCSVTPRP